MGLSLFVRMRDLMFLDPILQSYFGPTMDTLKFRVFDRQLPQGQITLGTCAIIQTVSQITTNFHSNIIRNPFTQDRVQISVVDKNPTRAGNAADAVCSFLDTANFVDNGLFSSPPVADTTPGQNIKLNQRGAFITEQTNIPIPVEILDYRISTVTPGA